MVRKNDLARVMADKMPRIKGMKVPTYLCEVIIDIVFDSIKEKLIEDGEVNIKNQFTFKRVDVPEHKKRMPDNTYVVVPFKSKIHIEKKDKFVSDINNEIRKKRMLGVINGCHRRVELGTCDFSNKELVEIQRYLDRLSSLMGSVAQ